MGRLTRENSSIDWRPNVNDKMYYAALHEAGHAVMARKVCGYEGPIEVSLCRCRFPDGFARWEDFLLVKLAGFAAWAVHEEAKVNALPGYVRLGALFTDVADLLDFGVAMEDLFIPFDVAVANLELHWGEVQKLAARLLDD